MEEIADDVARTLHSVGLDATVRLAALIPELDKYYPPGWRDFREPLPTDWRSGMFFMISVDGILHMKAMYGGAAGAGRAAERVGQVTGKCVTVTPPRTAFSSDDGAPHGFSGPYWRIHFIIPLSEVSW